MARLCRRARSGRRHLYRSPGLFSIHRHSPAAQIQKLIFVISTYRGQGVKELGAFEEGRTENPSDQAHDPTQVRNTNTAGWMYCQEEYHELGHQSYGSLSSNLLRPRLIASYCLQDAEQTPIASVIRLNGLPLLYSIAMLLPVNN